MEQSYEITEDGKAKTLNHLGVKPDKEHWGMCYTLEQWQKAENSRVTYEIEPVKIPCACNESEHVMMCFVCTEREYNPGEYLKPGTIVKGTLENGKIRIL